MDNKILVIGGIALAGLLLLNKKKTADGSSAPPKVSVDTNGVVTAKSDSFVTKSDGTVTDINGNPVNLSSLTDQQRQNLVDTLNAQNAAATAVGITLPNPGTTFGIPTDLYNTYLANKDLYTKYGKPAPFQVNPNRDGTVTVIPYDNPTHPVTFEDPDNSLTFSNNNGVIVSTNISAVKVSAVTTAPSSPAKVTPAITTPAITQQPVAASAYTQALADFAAIDALTDSEKADIIAQVSAYNATHPAYGPHGELL